MKLYHLILQHPKGSGIEWTTTFCQPSDKMAIEYATQIVQTGKIAATLWTDDRRIAFIMAMSPRATVHRDDSET